MKQIIILIIIVIGAKYLLDNFKEVQYKWRAEHFIGDSDGPTSSTGDYTSSTRGHTGSTSGISTEMVRLEKYSPTLRIVFYLDVSGSNKTAGVDLISSEIFKQYYNELEKEMEVNFGCIQSLSAKKLITLKLHAKHFRKPDIPDKRKVRIEERKSVAERYAELSKQYVEDSIAYYSKRTVDINAFRAQVDSAVAVFKKKLSAETDLSTAVTIADKTFNASQSDGARNCLILYSDGQDSYGKKIKTLNNKAEVILVNASGLVHTSIDSIITTTFQSPEQAIEYSLQ